MAIQTDESGAALTSENDPPREVALTVAANDRLLKALIALLAMRDPGILKELPTVFALAAREDGVIGEATEATWERIGTEIRSIRTFLKSESPEEHFDA
ncbi:hypothetical protein [Caulobacter sp. S45]|uniref:hypothetical protein n=1 Tax=Caulobacter sp. S45 TaxID=1641861 RepID=UPI00157589E9|nr:hypothetical protein [Caulobacter sp. S45]